ncbi:hypothetical protein AWM68_06275 [Fictibacillus phosphorivorans]|uniref:Uncharacterized protein n=1 Tax=Fictibacillus phosphorivorans TaxID=1221500 RepID=A0A161RW00_9BACL|nr:hypothetical protein [Fictibacillus phosphorivorans]KZE65982.1 hypothetical protein AWM68_06275 [Fictibacillus phosphorivorans]
MWNRNKLEVIDFREFISSKITQEQQKTSYLKPFVLTVSLNVLLIPTIGYAAGSEDAFVRIYDVMLNLADWMCAGTLSFAGGLWILGHRSKAIEYVISASAGYILIRHAIDIRDFLKTI